MASEGRLNIVASARMQSLIAEQQRAKDSVRALAREYGVTQATIKRAQRQLDRQERSARRAAGTNTKLGSSLKGVGRNAVGAVSGLTSFGGAAANLAAAGGPVGLAAAAIVAMGGASVAAAMKMSSLVDEIGLLAEGTGLSVRSTLALRRAFAEAGGSFTAAQAGLTQFVKKASDAATKGGEAAEVFERYQIATEGLGGGLRSTDEILNDVLRTLDEIDNPTERAALRMELFGARSGAAMAALSADTMQAALASTSELADNMDAAAGASADMDRATAQLSDSWENFVLILGRETAGPVAEAIDAMSALVQVLDEVYYAVDALREVTSWVDPAAYYAWAASEAWGALTSEIEGAAAQVERADVAFSDLTALPTALTPNRQEGKPLPRAKSGGGSSRADAVAEQQAKKLASLREEIEKAEIAAAAPADALEMRYQREMMALHDLLSELRGMPEAVASVEERRLQVEEEYRAQRKALREQEAAEIAAMEQRQVEQRQQRLEEQHQQEAARLAAKREMHGAVGMAGVDAAMQIASAVGGNSDIVVTAQIAQALAYQAAAMARAMAEGGLVAGIPAALGMAGVLAGAIKQARAAQGQFDLGGQVASGATQPDQGLARVRDGEVIMTPMEADRARRQPPPAAMIQIDHQTYDAAQRSSGRQSALFPRRRGRVST